MKNFSILIVEDDENDVLFMRHAFDEAGITNPCHVTMDGQRAIDYLSGTGEYSDQISHPTPCLILLDLKLPRKNGFEVLDWLRKQSSHSHLPVIVLSSSALPSDIEKAYDSGANSYVVKPSSVATRVELARVVKSYWIEFNEPPGQCTGEVKTGDLTQDKSRPN